MRISSIRGSSAVVALADQPAVAQNRDAVADLVDLIEKMRDEDDADAAQRELAHDREQDLDLVAIEARGRLVEDQHPRRLRSTARAIAAMCWTATE